MSPSHCPRRAHSRAAPLSGLIVAASARPLRSRGPSLHAAITCNPALSANVSSRRPSILANADQRLTGPLSTDRCTRVHRLNWATLLQGCFLATGVLGRTLDTFHTAGLDRGTGLNFSETLSGVNGKAVRPMASKAAFRVSSFEKLRVR